MGIHIGRVCYRACASALTHGAIYDLGDSWVAAGWHFQWVAGIPGAVALSGLRAASHVPRRLPLKLNVA